MAWTDDPVRDEALHTLEQEQRISELPVCEECGEPIQDDYYYEFEGLSYCPDCVSSHIRWQ